MPYPFCKSPIDTAGTGWGWENGKSCLVPIYKSAPATTQQPATQPASSNCGKPGYEAFTAEFCGGIKQPPASTPMTLMTMVNPVEQQQATETMVNVGSGQKTVTGSLPGQQSFPGQDSGGGDDNYYDDSYGQQGQGGSISLETFKTSCKGLKGKMGTNCCNIPKSSLLPDGGVVGLVNGQMVQQAAGSCDSGMGNLPLIAAAVVGVFLLSRML
jgi:hypothetical protein